MPSGSGTAFRRAAHHVGLFTEALYFLHGLRGWQGQDALWQYVKAQEIFLHSPTEDEPLRAYELMKQYHDTPHEFC